MGLVADRGVIDFCEDVYKNHFVSYSKEKLPSQACT
jgi:hypothetical protein